MARNWASRLVSCCMSLSPPPGSGSSFCRSRCRLSRTTCNARPVQPFEQLDFVYTPSADVAADMEQFVRALGASIAFAIEAFGARVALVRLAGGPPRGPVPDHPQGERP